MVLILKNFNLGMDLGQALAGSSSCRGRLGCRRKGSSERWSPPEICFNPGKNPSGAGRQRSRRVGVGRILIEYLVVARLGTSLHKAQMGTAET